MRLPTLAVIAASALACAGEHASGPGPGPGLVATGDTSVLKAAELARVRCLLVAPFDNGSDAPLASETATGALVSEVDAARVKVFPVPELRTLFRDTPLELPAGIGPSLALELAELLGADGVLYGSVEGHTRDAAPELLVSLRIALVPDHRLLFAQTVLVNPASGERTDSAVRRAVLAAARPALARLGDSGRKRCFDPERTRSLRKLALAEYADARLAHAPSPPARPPAAPAPAPALTPAPAPARPTLTPAAVGSAVPSSVQSRTPRQAEWTKRLESGERFAVEEVAFAGRTSDLQRDGGLADLVVALFAQPAVAVRLEGFVDTTNDPAADHKLSLEMAHVAAQKLAEMGIPRHRITWGGRGGESPRLPNFTARGRAANRRIEAVPLR